MIRFELPFNLPSLNVLLRRNRWARTSGRNQLAWEVLAAIGRQRPAAPLPRARMRVERHAQRMLDHDNIQVKALLDVLQPCSRRHPAGLGIILDDSPGCLMLEIVQVKLPAGADPKTVITIEEA